MKTIYQSLFIAALFLFACRLPVHALRADELFSGAAVLIDGDTGQVLFEKEKDLPVYPASTTKIMTAILVLERCAADEIVTVSSSALDINEWDSANIGLSVGEEITVDDALYALMLPSANDMANALAEHVAGTQEDFARLMTEKAHEIGAANTTFTNAHGLPDREHMTTAYDMALITRYAMQSRDFMRYFSADGHTVPATNLQPVPRELHNYQEMLLADSAFYDPSVTGGKVGYTGPARHTMSTTAEKYGRSLIAVVMLSGRDEKFYDTAALLQHGFNDFRPASLPASFFGRAEYSSDSGFDFLLRNDWRTEDVYIDGPEALPPDTPLIPVNVRIGGEGVLLGVHEVVPRAQPKSEAVPSWLAHPAEERSAPNHRLLTGAVILAVSSGGILVFAVLRLRRKH